MLNKATLRLAAGIARRYADHYAAYLAECEQDRRNGHRSHYCEHGMDLWVDWDPICGPCEDGESMRDPMVRRRMALDSAKERMAMADKVLAWVIESQRLGIAHAVDLATASKHMHDLVTA